MPDPIDWPPRRRKSRRGRIAILVALALIVFGGGTILSYYVDALWFDSLGFGEVFWKTLNLQGVVFSIFFASTFAILYGAFAALKPPRLGELTNFPILINGQPIRLPVEPVLKLIAGVASLLIAFATGAGLMAEWPTLALWWYARPDALPAAARTLDPIFARPLAFYLFALPAWQLISGWAMTLSVIVGAVALFFLVITGSARAVTGRASSNDTALRGFSIAFACVLFAIAWRVYLARFDHIYDDHTIFAGVTYADAHITLTGMLVVSGALVLGGVIALLNALAAPKLEWLALSVAPAAVCFVGAGVLSWYMTNFIVKPNELVRERPYIEHNIEMTRQAYALNRVEQHPFPAETGVEAADAVHNQATIQNIRLWDWRALQDTLRQIQEIRTYYDFPDIDIDRYEIDGQERQMMLAARELNVDRLPESSRNWINEKLIYTHGYGVTMNPVNGFTPEGLPALVLSNMPVQSTIPSLAVTRPEIYFGELTNTDVYVNTRQKEFNYPQGETNAFASYEGKGGIVLGGFLRRLLIALDRGDVTKLPFSDDIRPDSRLLMRRSIRDRLETLAPFLTFDQDPYIVVGEDGRLSWILDAYTTSDTFPYARHYGLGRDRINYVRNSVKAVVDAYDGTTTLYVFDTDDPIVAAYRAMFPVLFKDAAAMPPGLRRHVRYPELLLRLQAAVYGLYHMTDPEVFYNREDLWTVATEVGMDQQRQQATLPMEPNFVLMTLPGETKIEFVEILPFTPANKNNLIGWIAGRSDDPHYGTAIVYDFPKTRLIDGPLQVEARIDQHPQLSAQMTLWNQQGSHVRRGNLIVIPIGRALLYAEAIYLQAERSPMPELRIVVLAMQDRIAYGDTFEKAVAQLFGAGTAPHAPEAPAPQARQAPQAPSAPQVPGIDPLIAEAAKDLAEYQRLTAEGKLGEAGQRLEALKKALEQLASRRH